MAALAAAIGSVAAGAPAAPAAAPVSVKLSNETTFTRWATPVTTSAIRIAPGAGKVLTHLRYQTEDGYPEVYEALTQETETDGSTWIQIRVPGRPNGRVGWVRDSDLGPLNLVHTELVINRATLRATLYRNGRKVMQVPVGVGKKSTPTPAGHFWVRELLPNLGGAGVYGPWAFGTSAYSSLSDWPGGGVVGIHGTNQPALVPGRPSHGCVRVHNSDIRRLKKLMPIGTPVLIV